MNENFCKGFEKVAGSAIRKAYLKTRIAGKKSYRKVSERAKKLAKEKNITKAYGESGKAQAAPEKFKGDK